MDYFEEWQEGVKHTQKMEVFGHNLKVTYKTARAEGEITLELVEFHYLSNKLVKMLTAEGDLHIAALVEAIVDELGYISDNNEVNYGFKGHERGAKI